MSRRQDLRVVRVAATRHDVLGVAELAALGVNRHAIDRQLRSGQLHRRHHGVYAVGRAQLTPDGERRAAALAAGPRAVVSHRSAAQMWGLCGGGLLPVHVTVPGSGRRAHDGVVVHRSRNLPPEETTRLRAIPVCGVPRAMLDLAAGVSQTRLGWALEQAEHERLFDLVALTAICERHPGHPGASRLRARLARYAGASVTESELEREFLAFVRRHGLPEPVPQAGVAGHRVDFHWPRWRLVVELDSHRFHTAYGSFEDDRVKDVDYQRAGQRLIRVTSRRLRRDPDALLGDILGLAGLGSR